MMDTQANTQSVTSALGSGKAKRNFRFFFKIFLVSVFPTHFWTSLMIFNDLEFVSERTTVWDSIGYAGYSLLFALAESIVLAGVLWLISLAFPRRWSETRTLSVTGSILLVLAGAGILDMAAHAYNHIRVAKQYLYGLENFTTLTYSLIIGAILFALSTSLMLILKSRKGEKIFAEVFNRIMLLSYFYLLFDAAGLIIVVVRNIF